MLEEFYNMEQKHGAPQRRTEGNSKLLKWTNISVSRGESVRQEDSRQQLGIDGMLRAVIKRTQLA